METGENFGSFFLFVTLFAVIGEENQLNPFPMKKLFYLLLIAIVLPMSVTQCDVTEITDAPPDPGKTVTLTVSNAGIETRTSIDIEGNVGHVLWSEGDRIIVNGEIFDVVPDANDPTRASVYNVPESGEYYAMYCNPDYPPYSDGTNYYFYFADQIFENGTFAQYSNSMVAYSTSTELEFRNICGVVRLSITGTQTLKKLSFSSNSGETMAGYLSVPAEDIVSGNMQDYYGDFNPDYLPITSLGIELGPDGLQLDPSSPTYVYIVVPARVYESGFSVSMEDSEGNVGVQSTQKSIDVRRSSVVDMGEFQFAPLSPVSITDVKPEATAVGYTVEASPNSSVITVLVYASAWNEYMDSGYSDDQALAGDILDAYGSVFPVGAEGALQLSQTQAFNISGMSGVVSDTDYKILAAYSDGKASYGEVVVVDVRSAVAEGEAPEINISVNPTDAPYSEGIFTVRTTDASSIKYVMMIKASYDEEIASGYDNRSIVNNYGHDLDDAMVAEANSASGTMLQFRSLSFDSEYVLLIMAISATGVDAIASLEYRTEVYPGLDPSKEWELVSTDGYLECGLFYQVAPFTVENLTIEKMVGEDYFRVLEPFASCPELEQAGFVYAGAGGMILCDATDAANVEFIMQANNLGILHPDTGVLAQLVSVPLQSGSGRFGTYNAGEGYIDFGDTYIYGQGQFLYPMSGPTILYFHRPQSSGTGVSTEDFSVSEPIPW